jgi:hypothetical protein
MNLASRANSTDDMALLRHGGTGRMFTGAYAPATLGSFVGSFTFGHIRQLDGVLHCSRSRWPRSLACHQHRRGDALVPE